MHGTNIYNNDFWLEKNTRYINIQNAVFSTIQVTTLEHLRNACPIKISSIVFEKKCTIVVVQLWNKFQ